jgi:hypothetical protein
MKKIFLPFTNRRFSHVAGNVDDAAKALQKSQQEKKEQEEQKDKDKDQGEDGEADADKGPKEGDGATPAPEQQNGDGQTPAPVEPAVTTPEPVVTPAPEEPVVKEETPEPEVTEPATTIPTPSEEDIENGAIQLANNPHLLEPAKRTIARAEEIIADRNKPAPLSAEEQALADHEAKVALHGPDYVDAKRQLKGHKQPQFRTFSRQTWVTLGNNKSGWVEIAKEMPEAKAAKQTAAAPAAPAANGSTKKTPAKPNGKANNGKPAGK